jgi:hypothetical protein
LNPALPARTLPSLRIFPDDNAIVEACCQAWNSLVAEDDRTASLCNYPWIRKVAS